MKVASAPGKLFLTGEYAVLHGAPALVAAVDRRVRVQVMLGDADGLVVESLAEGCSVLRDPIHEPLPAGDAGAVLAAIRAVGADRVRVAHVVVDSRLFLIGERKLGLGRSAATLAAATVALLGGRPPELLPTALAANALLQDGQGSGADVVAAVEGGVVEVRRGGTAPIVTRRQLPPGLHLLAGWTGTPAPTAPLLARFAASAGRAPRVLEALCEVAEGGADAVARGDLEALLASVRRSAELLDRLGEEVGIPIVTPALRRLVSSAARVGAAAKPSGAGAGDCGIAFATSPRQAAEVALAWRREGIEPLGVAIASEGAVLG